MPLFAQLLISLILSGGFVATLALSSLQDSVAYEVICLILLHLVLCMLLTYFFLQHLVLKPVRNLLSSLGEKSTSFEHKKFASKELEHLANALLGEKSTLQNLQIVERQAAQSSVQLRGIIDSALDAVIVIDAEGIVTEWNKQAHTTFGWRPEEARGRQISELIIPNNLRKAHHDGMNNFHATGDGPVLNSRVEVPAINKSGDEFPVELTIIPIEVNGTHTFSAFVRDISQRKATEEKLAKERQLLEVTLESIAEGVVVTDTSGKVSLMNPEAHRLLKVKAENSDQHILDFIDDSNFAKAWAENSKVLQERIEDKDQILSATRNPLKATDETQAAGHVTIIRDITKQEEIDQMKTNFISSVSHELRTPLTSIKGFASTMLRAKALSEEERTEFLQIISSESDRLANLINDLLEISLVDSGQIQFHKTEINLTRIFSDIIVVIEEQCRQSNITFQHNISKIQGSLFADKGKLHSSILNLCANAVKFTPAGGRIEMRAFQKESNLEIEVEDNGLGIPEKDINKIFDRFFRVNRPGTEIQGTGLGLAIVKEIVEAHDGQISVSSELNKKTIFTISLPLT